MEVAHIKILVREKVVGAEDVGEQELGVPRSEMEKISILKIVYDINGDKDIDIKMERDLRKFLKKYGYEFWIVGRHINKRELIYEKKLKEV